MTLDLYQPSYRNISQDFYTEMVTIKQHYRNVTQRRKCFFFLFFSNSAQFSTFPALTHLIQLITSFTTLFRAVHFPDEQHGGVLKLIWVYQIQLHAGTT